MTHSSKVLTTYVANKENFNDFILSEGVNEDYSDLIENMFAAYSEDEKKNNRHRYPKKVRNFGLSLGDFAKEHTRYNKGPHVHLKTFLFNYKRYLKDKFKKKDLVSTKKAKDLNSLLREYINEWKADFPKFYLHKMAKNSEDDKVKALKDFLPLEIVLRLNRKDLETFNYHKLNEQYINVENKLKEFNNSPFNTVRLQDKYQNTCGRLTVSYI